MKQIEEPRNLCAFTGTIEHSRACRARWAPGSICNDQGQCTLAAGHTGGHVAGQPWMNLVDHRLRTAANDE